MLLLSWIGLLGSEKVKCFRLLNIRLRNLLISCTEEVAFWRTYRG